MDKVKEFSIVEILVTVALIAILTALTFFAINPEYGFAQTRNAQRLTDITKIMDAVTNYNSVQGNSFKTLISVPEGNTEIPTCITNTDSSIYIEQMAYIGTGPGNVNLRAKLIPLYIASIPMDPKGGTESNTGYKICKTDSGRVQINASFAENDKIITLKR